LESSDEESEPEDNNGPSPTPATPYYSVFDPGTALNSWTDSNIQLQNLMRNDHAGNSAGPKGDNTTWFSLLNINSVNLCNDAAALRDIFEDQRQIETDLPGLGEINVDPTQFGVTQKCYDTLQKSFKQGKMLLSSCSITMERE
jgi:hypothetical protein